MLKITYIRLRTKILVPVIGLVVVFALVALFVVQEFNFLKHNNEIIKKDTEIIEMIDSAKYGSKNINMALLSNAANELVENDKQLIEQLKESISSGDQQKVKSISEALITNIKNEREAVSKSTEENINNMIKGVLVYCLFTLPPGTIAGAVFAHKISMPLNKLTECAEQIADGKLDVVIPDIKTKDETEFLSKAFLKMVESLRNIITDLTNSSQKIGTTSEELTEYASAARNTTMQVAKAIGSVAKGATEQNNYVSSTVKVIDQVTRGIEQIATGAQEQSQNVITTTQLIEGMSTQANKMSDEVEKVLNSAQESYNAAIEGGKCVVKTVDSMKKIKDAVFETAEKLTGLGKTTQQMSEIVNVINVIAEQTNLLALNAAIEAARAGEQGKGFAVVADEVRSLSVRSSKATDEIAELIKNVKKETEEALKSMEHGTQEVQEGVILAQDAGKALNKITEVAEQSRDNIQSIVSIISKFLDNTTNVSESIANVSAITEENTASAEQMALSAKDVNDSIRNILSITEANGAAAEEVFASTDEMTEFSEKIANSADNLSKMAYDLQSLVDRFQI